MKSHHKRLFLIGVSFAMGVTSSAIAADLTWDGAVNSNWNTSDANWTSSTWNNSTPDNAIFHSVGGTVTLDSGISAGSVSVGNTGSNFASLTLTGGTLNASTLTVQGFGSNSGAYGSNPTLTVNSSVSLTGDAAIGRSNLDITGGTFTSNRIISASGSADWARLVISGGNVTATNGVDGSVNTGATFAVDLNGGTLSTPFIKVADREVGTSNNAWLTFNGGTVKATADTATFITTHGGSNNVYISNGGAIIDTNSHAITIGTILRNTSGQIGSLTKNGAGTLTLTQSNKHTGGTTVNNGMLVLAASAWTFDNVGGAGVSVGSGATLRADNSVANLLNGLTLNGGTVDAVNSAGNGDWGNFFLTGNVTATGTSHINADIALRSNTVDFNVDSGSTLNVGGKLQNGAFFGIYSGSPATVVKSGDGTMVLSGVNTYTGNTTVDAGTLSLGNGTTNANLSDGATVSIAFGATVNLNFAGTDTVGKLVIDGNTMSGGIYDSSHPTYGSYFTGTGSLTVLEQNGTWTSLTSGNWSTSANWLSDIIATGTDKTATFSAGTGSESITVTLDTPREIGNLSFSNANYTISGSNTLTLDSTTDSVISVGSGLTTTVSTNLSGIVGLVKNGAGTLSLSAGSGDNYANVYNQNISGGLDITEGTVEFTSQYIRMGTITVRNGATLKATQPWATGASNPWFNGRSAGAFIVEAGGTLTSTTIANSFVSGLTLSGGSLTAPGVSSSEWGAFIIASTVTADGEATSSISAELALTGNQTFYVFPDSALNVSSVVHNRHAADAGAITKDGEGTLTLGGANSYSGNTMINDGALIVPSSGSLRFYPTTSGTTNSVSSSGLATATLSFVGTVNLDLSAAVATAGNSWNLINIASFNTAPVVTPSSVTSNLGAFTEVSAGTWELPATGAKWVFTVANGNLAYVSNATPYETWASAYGLASGTEGGDLDNDGLTNFQEFAFGLIPNSGVSVNPITSQLNKTTGQFSYQRLNASSLSYSIWTSPDLISWTEDSTAVQNVTTGNPNDTVQVTLSATSPLTADKLFVRVKAQ